tara:strand:+ start:470 stop:742 length:273 start_codon:yes stop_codon:yes gene_type:complete
MANSLKLKVEDVPLGIDVLTVALIVVLVILLSNSNIVFPEESKLAFLLALIVLISCYSVEMGILVVLIAIIYVLVDSAKRNNNRNNAKNN